MLTCPVCGSEDVRRSRKKTILGAIKRWRGLQRYRCRECAKAFYRPLSPAERREEDRSEEERRKTRSERTSARKKSRRRKVEILVFVGMILIFYAALRVLTRPS